MHKNDSFPTALEKNSGFIHVSGKDAFSFLQGLITNDLETLTEEFPLFSAFLSAQGKYQYSFVIHKGNEGYLLEVLGSPATDLFKKLRMYTLRSDVDLEDLSSQIDTLLAFGGNLPQTSDLMPKLAPDSSSVGQNTLDTGSEENHLQNSFSFFQWKADPRLKALGYRCLIPAKTKLPLLWTEEQAEHYNEWRLSLGIPAHSEIGDRSVMEANFEFLNALSFTKGCYLGQELTARIKYRGLLKSRLFPVQITNETEMESQPSSTEQEPLNLLSEAGKKVGGFTTGTLTPQTALTADDKGTEFLGIARIRLNALEEPLFTEKGHSAKVLLPEWLKKALSEIEPTKN